MFKNPIYLIPYDFTPVAESALRLGLDLAEANDGSVYILHVVKKNAEKIQARTKFTALFNTLSKEEQAMTNTKVIVGDLYEDIGKAGDILKAALIVMGTHGAHGMQKVFGSHAVRIINSSSTPFLITQGKKRIDKIKTLIMPFNFAKESIQITSFAAAIAKKFNATIHLVAYHDKDSVFEAKTKSKPTHRAKSTQRTKGKARNSQLAAKHKRIQQKSTRLCKICRCRHHCCSVLQRRCSAQSKQLHTRNDRK
jgi:nucleotide-binding universal stress UspA family protein